MSEWQPIETAPRNTVVLTYDGNTSFGHQRYDLAVLTYTWRAYFGGLMSTPTHWMPLPQPPQPPQETPA